MFVLFSLYKITKNVPRPVKIAEVWLNLYPNDNNHLLLAANILVLTNER